MKMIFHYPGPFYNIKNTGEKKRPPQMRDAFFKAGVNIYEIIGTRQERLEKLISLKKQIKTFDFIYSENSTLPLRLCGSKNLPNIISPDIKLFKLAKNFNIPCGVFYRDLFWKYKNFPKQIGLLKYFLSLPLYKEELKLYEKNSNILFVPSARFSSYFLKNYQNTICELPPAEEVIKASTLCKQKIPNYKLLIVGCRQKQIKKYLKKQISTAKAENVVELIDWVEPADVKSYIAASKAGIIPHRNFEHTNTTVPHKLFQYMILRKPVLVSDCKPLKRIVEETESGLVFKANNYKNCAEITIEMYNSGSEKNQILAKNGWKAVHKKYSWNCDKQNLINIYENLR